jgi:hypothetical protein
VTVRPGTKPTYRDHEWGFCDGCSEPYPWANRQELIFQLQNLLDVQDISDHDRLQVREDLRQLQDPDVVDDPEKQLKLWAGIKRRAPGLVTGLGFRSRPRWPAR